MEDTKFKHNDKVKVVKGFYRGKTGKATAYYTTEVGCFNKVKTHWYSVEMNDMDPEFYPNTKYEFEKQPKRISFKAEELELIDE